MSAELLCIVVARPLLRSLFRFGHRSQATQQGRKRLSRCCQFEPFRQVSQLQRIEIVIVQLRGRFPSVPFCVAPALGADSSALRFPMYDLRKGGSFPRGIRIFEQRSQASTIEIGRGS